MSEKITNHFKMLRAVVDDAETAALAAASEHLHQLDKLRLECATLTEENARLAIENAESRKAAAGLFATCERLRSEREAAVAERVVYANVDTSLEDPRVGKLLVVRIDDNDALAMRQGKGFRALTEQFVGWLEAAQDEGDTETKAVDVHHTGMPTPVVRCGECTSVNGHFGGCAKAVQP